MIKVASLFSQLLHHFPRAKLSHLVGKHQAERKAKGFTCWTRLVAMLFCYLARPDSLRENCGGLAYGQGKRKYLGIGKAPNKSTLSYANKKRPAELFVELFWNMVRQFRTAGRLGNRKRKFRRARGGVKVHVLLDHDDYMPFYVWIAEAKPHDRRVAHDLHLKPGSIVAFDRACSDYALFSPWTVNLLFS